MLKQISSVAVGLGPVTAAEVVAVARYGVAVQIAEDALVEVRRTRVVIEALADDPHPHYGVSTGFGALATRHIPTTMRTQLQRSLIRSHAAGSGPEVEVEVVRALMLLRLSTLATGRTGVREIVVRTYADVLNAGITPIVHEYGSLGCSGDLAPLAHCALAVMGEGTVRDRDGVLRPAAEALAAAGITPVVLAEKEGLALINGTDGMLGMLALALHDLDNLVTVADVTAAMSVEGLLGTDDVFADDLQRLRPHPGQRASAANLRRRMAAAPSASRIAPVRRIRTAAPACRTRTRCAARPRSPAAPGTRSLTPARWRRSSWPPPSTTPSSLPDGRVESNGNFHGAPIAYVLDFLAIVVADLAGIAERRTDRFLDRGPQQRAESLPGRRSRRRLRAHDRPVHPGRDRLRAQATGRPGLGRLDPQCSAMQEDHVSMGWSAARSCGGPSTASPGCWPSSCSPPPAARASAAPLTPAPATAAVIAALRAAGARPRPRSLARAGDRHGGPTARAAASSPPPNPSPVPRVTDPPRAPGHRIARRRMEDR